MDCSAGQTSPLRTEDAMLFTFCHCSYNPEMHMSPAYIFSLDSVSYLALKGEEHSLFPISQLLFSGDPLLVTMDMQTGGTVFLSFIHTPTNICTSVVFRYRPGLCWIWLNLELFYTFL